MKADLCSAKMAKRENVMAMEAGRSPSGVEKAYVAAVASKKNLTENDVNVGFEAK